MCGTSSVSNLSTVSQRVPSEYRVRRRRASSPARNVTPEGAKRVRLCLEGFGAEGPIKGLGWRRQSLTPAAAEERGPVLAPVVYGAESGGSAEVDGGASASVIQPDEPRMAVSTAVRKASRRWRERGSPVSISSGDLSAGTAVRRGASEPQAARTARRASRWRTRCSRGRRGRRPGTSRSAGA